MMIKKQYKMKVADILIIIKAPKNDSENPCKKKKNQENLETD